MQSCHWYVQAGKHGVRHPAAARAAKGKGGERDCRQMFFKIAPQHGLGAVQP